jgi:threonine/homoserine/homoserine lactone efflux protein
MIPFNTIVSFVIASALLALSPGPDNIFVLTQSALYGWKRGFIIIAGLGTGLLFHTTIVALGVAALFKTSVIAFTALKIAGAAFLLYLAYGAFTAKVKNDEVQANQTSAGMYNLYLRGLIMNVTNPKVSIFFLAFLPQFAKPENGPIYLQIFLLGALFMLSALVVFGAIALGAGIISDQMKKSDRVQLIMNKIAAVVFVLLALRLVVLP